MAERLPSRTKNEALLPTERRPEVMLPTAEQAEPLRPGEKIQNVEQARSSVEHSLEKSARANPIEALNSAERAGQPASRQQISRELRQVSLQRELTDIRRQLSAPQRALSRLIHQPSVKVVSDAAGRTVSRPSGLLGGGLVAFIGSTGYLWLAHHTGFRYNYLVWLALLAGGFAVGVALEGLVWLATRSRRHHD